MVTCSRRSGPTAPSSSATAARASRIRRARRRCSPSCAGSSTRGVSPPWTTAADEELTRRAFGRGEAIFLRNWPYALDLFEQPDSPVRGRVGIAPLPRHRDGARGAGSTGGSHLAIHRGTRHPDLALELVRALTSEPAAAPDGVGRRALSDAHGALPRAGPRARASGAAAPSHALTLAGRPRPVTPYYVMISTLLQPELSAALVGVKTPARAVAEHAGRRVRALARGASGDARASAPTGALGVALLSPALDRARRRSRVYPGPLGALALAPAAHADLRHRPLRRASTTIASSPTDPRFWSAARVTPSSPSRRWRSS